MREPGAPVLLAASLVQFASLLSRVACNCTVRANAEVEGEPVRGRNGVQRGPAVVQIEPDRTPRGSSRRWRVS